MPETTGTEEVRRLIAVSGIPYTQIADGCGVSPATISRIVNGNSASTDSVECIAAFLRPLVPEPTPDLPEAVPREMIAVLLQEKDKQIAQLRVSNAAHMETVKKVARQRLRWALIEAVMLIAIVAWFLWDLTHPEVGLIRLKQAGYIVGQLIGLAWR